MPRNVRVALILAVVAATVPFALANHPSTDGTHTVTFDHKEFGAGEWWVEVFVSGPSAATLQSVQAMDTDGPWVGMTYRSDIGTWGTSFHIETGHLVRFRAGWADGASLESCWFTHPDGAEQCPTAPGTTASPSPSPSPTPTPSPTVTTTSPSPGPAALPREAEAFVTKTAGGRIASSAASGGAYWNLWSNGYIEDRVPGDGLTKIVVAARGTVLAGVSPTMVVSVDGAVTRTHTVGAASWTDYEIGVLPPGDHVLGLAFTNDAQSSTEDRNLLLDVVRASTTATPTPSPSPSSSPTPSPTTTPSPGPAALPREAEAFAVKTAGGRISSSSASGGAYWNLWSNGYIEDHVPGDGINQVVIAARGTPVGGVWPTMVLSVDGTVTRTYSVATTTWTPYGAGVLAPGDHVLRIRFTNDAQTTTEDRNLLLDVARSAPALDASVRVAPDGGGLIDPRIYSFNVASWVPSDYSPPNATFVAMLRQLHPALLRFPPGHDGQHTYFDPTNTYTTPPVGYTRLLRGDTLDQFVATARQAGAEPMIEVNLKTGTPEMAASLVTYANVERGHGIRWFELGNEPDLDDGFRTDPTTEADKFLRFAAAMRAADPTIQLVGGSIMTGANAFGTNGRTAWLPPFSERVGSNAQALSWHWYPLDSDQTSASSSAYPSVSHLLQESAPDWQPSGMDFAAKACASMAPLKTATGAEHWVTEMGPDSGARQAPGITNGQAAAVWIADTLPRLAECGAGAVFQFAVHQHPGSVLVLMTSDRQPTPQWGAYQLLAQNYGGAWRSAAVDGPRELSAHASRLGDGTYSVVLVNKGATPLRISLDLAGAAQAHAWTLDADSPTSTVARVNGRTLDQNLVLSGLPPTDARLDQAIEIPPYSVVALRSL